jgi:hypothetical protein
VRRLSKRGQFGPEPVPVGNVHGLHFFELDQQSFASVAS